MTAVASYSGQAHDQSGTLLFCSKQNSSITEMAVKHGSDLGCGTETKAGADWASPGDEGIQEKRIAAYAYYAHCLSGTRQPCPVEAN